jgi:hypothetical protein
MIEKAGAPDQCRVFYVFSPRPGGRCHPNNFLLGGMSIYFISCKRESYNMQKGPTRAPDGESFLKEAPCGAGKFEAFQ